ncbi:mediator complex, subunit Med18 [Tuber brumale]|nr:mediator complex, subunit Med18 [Tuber brumale]
MPPPLHLPFAQSTYQELSLYSHIPAARQPQILRVISGITGMLPETTLEHHLVYKPKRPRQPGQNAELYYLQLISIVPEEQKQEEEGEGKKGYDVKSQRWRMRLEDIPEVTRRPVTSRNVLGAGFGEGDALGLVDSLGFMLQTTYFMTVSTLIHNNIIITLSQVLLPPPPPPAVPNAQYGNPYPTPGLQPLDPARSWVLKAAVRVQSHQDVESINTGINELKVFKELMRGMCDLEVAERLALDTRVR